MLYFLSREKKSTFIFWEKMLRIIGNSVSFNEMRAADLTYCINKRKSLIEAGIGLPTVKKFPYRYSLKLLSIKRIKKNKW